MDDIKLGGTPVTLDDLTAFRVEVLGILDRINQTQHKHNDAIRAQNAIELDKLLLNQRRTLEALTSIEDQWKRFSRPDTAPFIPGKPK